MLYLAAVPGRTPRMLADVLQELGVQTVRGGVMFPEVRGIVCYGRHVQNPGGLPVLNARAGTRSKFQELCDLSKAGISVPVTRNVYPGEHFGVRGFTFLRRQFHHTKGRDIRTTGRGDFYVEFIPKVREYRVWAYRRRPLATYEKKLNLPRRNRWARRRGRLVDIVWNWGNGYTFEFYHEAPEALKALGAAAVDALGLDFGAADIIEDREGRLYVLEVNTAPGVREPRQGLTWLAKKIANWERLGFPKRKGEVDGA